MTTDTSEQGVELLILRSLTGLTDEQILKTPADGGIGEGGGGYAGAGYVLGRSEEYDREHAVDRPKLLAFLQTTQPQVFQQLALGTDGPGRRQFLGRLQGEIAKRGIVDVLRKGIAHGPAKAVTLFGTPTSSA